MPSIRLSLFTAFALVVALAAGVDALLWSNRIDTHVHAVPPEYARAVAEAGGDPSGFSTPQGWTPQTAISTMNLIGVERGIMSVSSPGVPIAGTGARARDLCRSINLSLANYSTDAQYAGRLGFFGALPDWRDVQGTLDELDFLYSTQQRASGVIVYTGYGGRLLGDPLFKPIWARLEQYKALIFLHPGVLDVTPKFMGNGLLPQPVIDYPLATTRAAIDLVITGTFTRAPSVDIILAHAGGTLPYLGERIIGGLAIPQVAVKGLVNAVEAAIQFKRFYHDVALSTSDAQLDGLLDWAGADRVVFGSDTPYAPDPIIAALTAQYELFVNINPRGKQLSPDKLRSNSLSLLSKHAPRKSS